MDNSSIKDAFIVSKHQILISLHWIFTAVNFVLATYVICRLRKATLIHVNLRIVLSYTFFMQYNLISLGRIGDELNIWLMDIAPEKNLSTTEPTGVLFLKNTICLVTKLVHDTGVILSANSDLLVLLERFLATFLQNYESKHSCIGLGIIVTSYAFCIILVFTLFIYDLVVAGNFNVFTSMVSCHTSVLHPTTILVFWVWAVTASLTGFIGLVILYKFNKKKSEQWLGGQLAKRYQFSENVRTLRSVIPVIGLNAVGFTFGLYFVRKMFTDYVEEGGTSIVFTDTFLFQFMYAFADIYGLIFLLTFIVRNRQVMEILMGDVRICCANNKKNDINAADRSRYGSRKVDKYAIHPSTMTDTHFEQLAQIWK